MKGIILAGGSGTRLYPATLAVNKQLLPVYDKPMIYYPLSVLMLANINEILIISTPESIDQYRLLMGDGKQYGISLNYAVQQRPEGIAQAFQIAKEFLDGSSACLILGDNIFYGAGLPNLLKIAVERAEYGIATLFAYQVDDPTQFGVVNFDSMGKAESIQEKPQNPESNWAITGLYFYDHNVVAFAESLTPSSRGELEITDLNNLYMGQSEVYVERLSRGYAWLDTGTHDGLLEASEFVRTIQRRQGIQIACLEEIAWRNDWIKTDQLLQQAVQFQKTAYGRYLSNLAGNLQHSA